MFKNLDRHIMREICKVHHSHLQLHISTSQHHISHSIVSGDGGSQPDCATGPTSDLSTNKAAKRENVSGINFKAIVYINACLSSGKVSLLFYDLGCCVIDTTLRLERDEDTGREYGVILLSSGSMYVLNRGNVMS